MPLRHGRAGNESVDLLLLVQDSDEVADSLALARLLCCDVRPGRAGLTLFSFASKSASAQLRVPLDEEWRSRLGPQLESCIERSAAAVPSLKSALRAALIALRDRCFSGQQREVVLLLTSCPERLDEDCLQPLFSIAHSRNVRRVDGVRTQRPFVRIPPSHNLRTATTSCCCSHRNLVTVRPRFSALLISPDARFAPVAFAQLSLAARCSSPDECLQPYACEGCGLVVAAAAGARAREKPQNPPQARESQPGSSAAESQSAPATDERSTSSSSSGSSGAPEPRNPRLHSIVRALCSRGVLSPVPALEASWQRCFRSAPATPTATVPLGALVAGGPAGAGSSGAAGGGGRGPATPFAAALAARGGARREGGSLASASPPPSVVTSVATGPQSALDWLPFPLSAPPPRRGQACAGAGRDGEGASSSSSAGGGGGDPVREMAQAPSRLPSAQGGKPRGAGIGVAACNTQARPQSDSRTPGGSPTFRLFTDMM